MRIALIVERSPYIHGKFFLLGTEKRHEGGGVKTLGEKKQGGGTSLSPEGKKKEGRRAQDGKL